MARFSRFFLAVAVPSAVAILASACGGGGGGGGGGESDIVVSSTPPRVTEFSRQWGLSRIGADRAYANLRNRFGPDVSAGKGVTIGILDTGIDLNHPAFVTNVNDPDKDRKITRELLPGVAIEDGSEFSHGTAVAGVAAGGRNIGFPGSTHGVAWNANLAVFAIPLGTREPGDRYSPTDLNGLTQGDKDRFNRWFSTPLSWRGSDGERVDILNLSFAITGIIEGYSETELRTHLGTIIQTMAQDGVTDKTIFVWAASNSHGDPCNAGPAECKNGRVDATSPSILAGLPARISELQGHIIAVVSVDEGGAISSFSNRCGIAADWCLAAPGRNVLVPYFGPRSDTDPTVVRGYARVNGTSVAAPMVSGGLALMKQLFRDQVPGVDLVERLFETANDRGIYADSSIYGHGLMDLGAATSPVGNTLFTLGNQVGDPGSSFQRSSVTLGNAFGDGLTQSLAGMEIAAFDTLGAPFWFDLGKFLVRSDSPSAVDRIHDFMAPVPAMRGIGARRVALGPEQAKAKPGHLRLGLLESPMGAEGGHLALARHASTLTLTGKGGLKATAFSTEGAFWQKPASGVTLAWQSPGAQIGMRAGWLAERKSLLGGSAKGAFGKLSSDSAFVGMEAAAAVAGWQLGAGAEIGMVTAEPRGGLMTDLSPMATSTFAFHAMRPFSRNRSLWFSVSQPLRIESGRATLSVPVGRTKGGDVVRQSVTAGVVPTGRRIDVAAHWHQPLGPAGDLRLGAVWIRHPGHRATASPDFSLLATWRSAF